MNLVVPGERLAGFKEGVAGAGVYEINGYLYSALVGHPHMDPDSRVVTVRPYPENANRSVVPAVEQVIIGTVTKITAKYAAVNIKAVEREDGQHSVLPEPFRGTIRSQDIWSEEDSKEQPQVSLCFAPGDLVRAKLIGVGDASAGFLLSTGMEPRFGVIFARSSASGMPLVPVAWNAMVCSKTGIKESRKCARPESTA